MSWRWATVEESRHFETLPSSEGAELESVFPAVGGTILSRSGEELQVPRGKHVALFDADLREGWCYQTRDLTILMAGREVTLRPGTWVAVFSPAG